MKDLAPLILIIAATILLFAISYFIIAKESNKTKKGILNLTQLFILLFIWKFSTLIYVEELNYFQTDTTIFIGVLIIAGLTALINYSSKMRNFINGLTDANK